MYLLHLPAKPYRWAEPKCDIWVDGILIMNIITETTFPTHTWLHDEERCRVKWFVWKANYNNVGRWGQERDTENCHDDNREKLYTWAATWSNKRSCEGKLGQLLICLFLTAFTKQSLGRWYWKIWKINSLNHSLLLKTKVYFSSKLQNTHTEQFSSNKIHQK